MNIDVGYLRFAGIDGYNWSRLASSSYWNNSTTPSAYDFGIYTYKVQPSDGPDYRWYGFPLS